MIWLDETIAHQCPPLVVRCHCARFLVFHVPLWDHVVPHYGLVPNGLVFSSGWPITRRFSSVWSSRVEQSTHLDFPSFSLIGYMITPINLHSPATQRGGRGSQKISHVAVSRQTIRRVVCCRWIAGVLEKKQIAFFFSPTAFPLACLSHHRSPGLIRICMLWCLPLINIRDFPRCVGDCRISISARKDWLCVCVCVCACVLVLAGI